MTDRPTISKAAFLWWTRELSDHGPGRMARAQLRRCSTPSQALAFPATHALHAALGGGMIHRADTLALIAVALANLRESDARRAAERMGDMLSPLRFQTLIRAKTPGDLFQPLRRALVQIDGRANVGALAEDLFFWGDKTRNRWCFDYYGAGYAEPSKFENNEPETHA